MKKLYDWFVSSNQPKRAEEISNIPRYAKFKEKETSENKLKKVK